MAPCSNHLIRHPGSSWHDVPDLPKAAVAALDAGFVLHTTRLLGAQRSCDGETTKLLVQLQDGLQVEAVVMEYDNTGALAGRGGDGFGCTLTLSGDGVRQPGCPCCAEREPNALWGTPSTPTDGYC